MASDRAPGGGNSGNNSGYAVTLFIRGQSFDCISLSEPIVTITQGGRIHGVVWEPEATTKIGFIDWSTVDAFVWKVPKAEPQQEPPQVAQQPVTPPPVAAQLPEMPSEPPPEPPPEAGHLPGGPPETPETPPTEP